eukprot:Rmarinus@m.20825
MSRDGGRESPAGHETFNGTLRNAASTVPAPVNPAGMNTLIRPASIFDFPPSLPPRSGGFNPEPRSKEGNRSNPVPPTTVPNARNRRRRSSKEVRCMPKPIADPNTGEIQEEPYDETGPVQECTGIPFSLPPVAFHPFAWSGVPQGSPGPLGGVFLSTPTRRCHTARTVRGYLDTAIEGLDEVSGTVVGGSKASEQEKYFRWREKRLVDENLRLTAERDYLRVDRDELSTEVDTLRAENVKLRAALTRVEDELETLRAEQDDGTGSTPGAKSFGAASSGGARQTAAMRWRRARGLLMFRPQKSTQVPEAAQRLFELLDQKTDPAAFARSVEELGVRERRRWLVEIALQFRRVGTVLSVANSIGHFLQLPKVIERITSDATKILACERASLYVVDNRRGDMMTANTDGTEVRLPIGQGISGHVARTGEALNIEDAYFDPRFDSTWDKRHGYRTKSVLCVPFKSNGGKVLAVLQAINKVNGTFTKEDQVLLEVLSEQVGIVLQNSLAYDSQATKLNKTKVILESIGDMIRDLDEENVFAKLRAYAMKLTDAERCFLYYPPDLSKQLPAVTMEGCPAHRVPIDASLPGEAFSTKQALRVSAPQHHARFYGDLDIQLGQRTTCVMCVPVIRGDNILAVIEVANKKTDKMFTAEDQEFVELISTYASEILVQARQVHATENEKDFMVRVLNSLPQTVFTLGVSGTLQTWHKGISGFLGQEYKKMQSAPYVEWLGRRENMLSRDVSRVFAIGKPIVARDYKFHPMTEDGEVATFHYTLLPLKLRNSKGRQEDCGIAVMLEFVDRMERMKSTLTKYMQPARVEVVLNQASALLEGLYRKVTVVHADLTSFQSLMEGGAARHAVEILNQFFAFAYTACEEQQGLYDKTSGSSVTLLFGIPF